MPRKKLKRNKKWLDIKATFGDKYYFATIRWTTNAMKKARGAIREYTLTTPSFTTHQGLYDGLKRLVGDLNGDVKTAQRNGKEWALPLEW